MDPTVLSSRERHLVRIAALTVSGHSSRLGQEAERARAAGVEQAELREAVLLASLFAGFPRGLAAFQALGGAPEPPPADPAGADGSGARERRELGVAVFHAVHGPTAAAQLALFEGLPPAFVDGLLGYAYGTVISRERFDLRLRELVAIACLTALGLHRTLRAHLLAALRHGSDSSELRATAIEAGAVSGVTADGALREIVSVVSRRIGEGP